MSFTQDYNKELYHYGVKGMKWGKRKAQPQRSLWDRVTGADKYREEMMRNFAKDAAKKRASNSASLVSPKKQKPVGPVAGGPKKQKPVGPVASIKTPAKKVSNGKKKANKVIAENGNKTLKSLGKTVQYGKGILQIQYNMSDNAQRNRQMSSYLNNLAGMSDDYKRRFVY